MLLTKPLCYSLNLYAGEGAVGAAWPAALHVVGKDIVWFHAVIWPAMLWSVGLPPLRSIYIVSIYIQYISIYIHIY